MGRDEVASGRLEAVEWNKTLSENKVFNSFSFSPLEGATNPYTEANYKPTFLSDDELKHLILRVCCNYGIVFTQHLFSQISALSASVWEFNVSTLNLFRLTSCVRVSTLFLLIEQASHLIPGTLLFYPHSKRGDGEGFLVALSGVATAAGNAHFVRSWVPKDRNGKEFE